MADTDYSIDLRTRSPFWARMASILTGGRPVTPDKGSQMAGTSAHGVVGDSVVTDERNMQISTVWACIRLISTVTASLPLDVYQTKMISARKWTTDTPCETAEIPSQQLHDRS